MSDDRSKSESSYEQIGIASGKALALFNEVSSVAAKEMPKMSIAGRLDFAMELVMGLPMERDDQGNVTKRGPPLVTPEQALELLKS